MTDFTYKPKVRNMEQFKISDEDLRRDEERMDSLNLEQYVKINGKMITTIGEIKKYLKKIKDIEKLMDHLEESDYEYLYKWLQFKLMGRIY